MPMKKTEKIWFNGQFVPWDEAQTHVMSHVIHYGSSVFEGIRCYDTKNGPAVFCLDGHVDRMYNSCKIIYMEIPFSKEEISQAILDTVRVNNVPACYIRPVVFRGYDSIGVDPRSCPVEVAIGVIEWGAYLGEEALEQGVDVCVSSWNRMAPNTHPAMAKVGGNYVNSQLVKMEALRRGFAEGIVLDVRGYVSEGSGENLFMVNRGVISTPPLVASILAGITRECVLILANDLGYPIKEQAIPREALYIADELFFSGTAAEITPIRSADELTIGGGSRGPVTKALQEQFFGITSGELPDRHSWLSYV